MRFSKGHGTGNDFVLIPDPDGDLALTPHLVAQLCDRRRGLGADGVLRVVLTAAVPEVAHLAAEARWFLDYWNADGTVAEMCGNGARVYARYLVRHGYAGPGVIPLATRSGVRTAELGADGDVRMDMGEVDVRAEPRLLAEGPGTEIWVGNPHVVVEVPDVAALPHPLPAPRLEPPMAANVEFVQRRGPDLVMRVHERGVGETQSCGTGACAAAVAAALWDGKGSAAAVVYVPGGRLQVDWDGRRAHLTGPAELVADGEVEQVWLAARQ